MLIHSERLSRNNFDLLRLCFAAAVVFSHAYYLSGREELAWLAQLFSSTLAVKAFFVVSGFLIVMSYERSSSLASYASKRARRIYPAYLTVVLLSAFCLWAVSSTARDHYFSSTWLKYLVSNLSFLNFVQPSLPGVFEMNRVTAINGALWTLKIEVMFYLSVPLIVMTVRRFGPLIPLSLLYAGSLAYAALLTELAQRTGSSFYVELSRQLPGQLSYFVAGALLYYYVRTFERKAILFVVPALVVMCLNEIYALTWLEPFALAVLVIFLGLFFYLGNFGKYGDFSYGLYILHFPIVQLTVHSRILSEQPALYLLFVVSTSGIAAFAMWHLVEKRFLDRAGHYRVAAGRSNMQSNPQEIHENGAVTMEPRS